MPPIEYASISAAIDMAILLILYYVLARRRRIGKSDLRQSRIIFVISSFGLPILITTGFVALTVILNTFYHSYFDIGQHGGGVFVVLVTTVVTSIITLLLLLPRIKRSFD